MVSLARASAGTGAAGREDAGREAAGMDTQVRGWLLALCPILMVAMFAFFWPNISDGMNPAEQLLMMSEQGVRARIAILATTFVILGFLIGLALLARAMRGPEKPGSIWAEIARILFLVGIPVMLISMGSSWAALQNVETNKVLAEAMILNGEGISEMGGLILGLAGLLLTIAVVLQKRFHVAIGYIAIVFAALVFINEITEDLVDVLAVSWLILILLSVAMGILTIIGKERQWQSQASSGTIANCRCVMPTVPVL